MRKIVFISLMAIGLMSYAQLSKPVYLDESKDLEERIGDALRRMTLA